MNNDTAGAAFSMLIAAIGLMLLLLIITTSAPAGICLTYQEARHLFPAEHLWFYSKNHCWSNRRGGPPTKLRIDPIDDKKPRRIGGVKVVPPDEYNELDAALDTDLFFSSKPFPYWELVMKLDRYRFTPWYERIGAAFSR